MYADCPFTQFRCSDGTCVYHEHVCDGLLDCDDGSDENNDTCGKCAATVLTDFMRTLIYVAQSAKSMSACLKIK